MVAYNFCIVWVGLIFGFGDVVKSQMKKSIKVTAVTDPPFLFEDNKGQFTGLIPDLLDRLGYNYSIYKPSDQRYGSMLANGKWTGMVGEIVEKKADVAAILTVTAKRAEAVDFSYPVMSVGHSILMKKPARPKRSLTENLGQLLAPMTYEVWILSLLAMLITGMVLYIIMRFNPNERRSMGREHEATARDGKSVTCLNTYFFVFSTLMWRGYTHAPRSIGARILVVAWWAFTVIFIVSYTACLTNYLRVGAPRFVAAGYVKVRSFRDLAKNDEIRVGMLPAGSTHSFFKNSKSLVYRQIYEKVTGDFMSDRLHTTAELVAYLRGEARYTDYSVILESSTAIHIANQKPCDLFVVHTGSAVKQVAFGLQKNSILREEISTGLIQLADVGELNDLELKWFKSKCDGIALPVHDGSGIDVPSFYSLDYLTFSTALLIVVAGNVLGTLVSIIEICIYRWAERHPGEDAAEYVTNRSTNKSEPATEEKLLNQEEKGKSGGASV